MLNITTYSQDDTKHFLAVEYNNELIDVVPYIGGREYLDGLVTILEKVYQIGKLDGME